MYIPLLDPPAQLPSYVTLDARSQWHNSAILSMALESMTLPSRLKPINGQHSMLSQMEAALNTNGHQKIARLQCSITDPESARGRASSGGAATRDQRLPTTGPDIANSTNMPREDMTELPNAGLPAFDMDLLPGENESYGNKVRKAHIFGQVETLRGNPSAREPQDEDKQGFVRKRRRIAGLPNIETLVIPRSSWRHTVILSSSAYALREGLQPASTLGGVCHPTDQGC